MILGEVAQIEFMFEKPISDYELKIDYEVESTDKNEFPNSKLIIIDEQYRKYVIDNFNYVFNYKYITGETISKFLNPNNNDPKNEPNKKFVKNGYSIKNDINNLNSYLEDFKMSDRVSSIT